MIVLYIINAVILLLHEIDSAYWKECEILPFARTPAVFLLLHVPLIALLFWGSSNFATGRPLDR